MKIVGGHIHKKRHSTEIDVHVGGRVRQLRELRGLSRETIAQALNITHQQFQKYETGQNRISAGRLPIIACLLGIEISYFYEGLPEPGLPETVSAIASASPATRLLGLTAECRKFLELFVRIRNPHARKSVVALVLFLAGEEDANP